MAKKQDKKEPVILVEEETPEEETPNWGLQTEVLMLDAPPDLARFKVTSALIYVRTLRPDGTTDPEERRRPIPRGTPVILSILQDNWLFWHGKWWETETPERLKQFSV